MITLKQGYRSFSIQREVPTNTIGLNNQFPTNLPLAAHPALAAHTIERFLLIFLPVPAPQGCWACDPVRITIKLSH